MPMQACFDRKGSQLQHKIERNEAAFKFNPLTDDVYAVASLLKVLRLVSEYEFLY